MATRRAPSPRSVRWFLGRMYLEPATEVTAKKWPRAARQIMAFSTGERIVHWVHTIAFLVLLATGMVLVVPPLAPYAIGEAGMLTRLIHRMGAVLFALVPFLYVLLDPEGVGLTIRDIFSWSRRDIGWARAAVAYYFFGREEAMPPQHRFNTGQKLFYCLVVLSIPLFGVTGLAMWFGKGRLPATVLQACVILHDWTTIAVTALFLVHFVLSVVHPLMKGAINGMLSGWVPEEYIRSHHARWYEEIVEKGQEAEPPAETLPADQGTS